MKKIRLLTIVLALILVICSVMMTTACGGSGTNNDERNTYVFEAEGIDVTGLTGRGYSVSYAETELIIGQEVFPTIPDNVAKSMSNGFCIAYWNTPGTTLTFNINADKASENNTITLRVSSEYGSLDVTKEALSVIVNDEELDYSPFTIVGENLSNVTDWHGLAVPFADYNISAKFPLKAGENVIKIRTNANEMGFPEDSFLNSVSPDLDCIKIKSDSVLTWNSMWEENKDTMGID